MCSCTADSLAWLKLNYTTEGKKERKKKRIEALEWSSQIIDSNLVGMLRQDLWRSMHKKNTVGSLRSLCQML